MAETAKIALMEFHFIGMLLC